MTHAPASGADPAPELQETVARLQSEGQLEAAGEGVVLRHFQDRQQSLRSEMQRLAPEYAARVERDGEQAANAWLAETAQDMGRRDGNDTRRVLSTVLPEA